MADSRTGLYDRIKTGLFVPPVKLGRTSLWPAHEVRAIQSALLAGRTDDEVRALVRDLVAARKNADAGEKVAA